MRHKTHTVKIGGLDIGGNAPIAIQSMTNTDTADVAATVTQICELVDAGSEMVRVTVNNENAAKAVPHIKEALIKKGVTTPLIGDFHFNGHLLLTKFKDCAAALDKYRINPGNVGSGTLHDKNFATMTEVAIREKKPVRIGANWGSLDPELLTEFMEKNAKRSSRLGGPKPDSEVLIDALVESAVRSAAYAETLGLRADQIVLSVKTSNVNAVIAAYRMLAKKTKYALHLGLTEAGMGTKGVVSSSAALAILLHEGIGDTIRVSLTPEPGAPRAKEVEVCKLILQSLEIRQFNPSVTSCPGCGRTGSDLFQKISMSVNEYIKKRMPDWKRMSAFGGKIESLKVAVMGCVVNGPGESKHADIALSLPGKSEEPIAVVFIKGKIHKTLRGKNIEQEFLDILEQFCANRAAKELGL